MKNFTCVFFSVCALIVVLFSGCATVTRGTKDVLIVETEPPGATVTCSNGMTGTTPTSFKLPRKDDIQLTIEKPGYETVTVDVRSGVSTGGSVGMAGNVLLGGLVGAGIDAATGAMNSLKPNPVQVNLVPVGSTPVPVRATEAAPEPAPTPQADEE